jgi:hypothetical protein
MLLDRLRYMEAMSYEVELSLRKRRALIGERLTLLKELRKVKRELGYDRSTQDHWIDHKGNDCPSLSPGSRK